MRKGRNIEGMRFHRLEVIYTFSKTNGNRTRRFSLCMCDCGKFPTLINNDFISGHTKSCGCYAIGKTIERRTKHGQSRRGKETREYRIHRHIMGRCLNSNNKDYKNYGGRGITVCDRWLGKHGFENFYEDVGEIPKGYSIDRIDNNGNYCPENCKISTREEQNNNTRNNIWIEYNGETKTAAQWAKKLGIKYKTFYKRLKDGWSIEEALTTPVRIKTPT